MNFRQSFKMSMQSILSNKVRSFLTMLGIIIGVAAVMIMVSVVQGQNVEMKKYYESMGTNRINVSASQWNAKDITQDLYDYCLSLSEFVDGVTPSSTYYGTVKYKTKNCDNYQVDNNQIGGPQVYLGSDQFSICNNFTIAEGRDLSYLDIKKYNQIVVIGDRLRSYLFEYQDPLGKEISIGGQTFKVVGVYAAKDPDSDYSMDYMAVVPYTMNRLLNKTTQMQDFTVKAKSASATTDAITRINGFLSGIINPNTGYYYVQSDNSWMQQSDQQNKMMSYVLGGIAGISLLVGGIGIMNIMLVTVTERTREIGIRKAIGGSRRSIIGQFLIEAATLCGVGGILGVLLGYLGTLVAGKLILKITLLPSVPLTLSAVGFSVVLGVGFGMYPAIKASGLQPVEALRAE